MSGKPAQSKHAKKRDSASVVPGTGVKRYGLRAGAADKGADAFTNENYVETIALIESILFDQLYSRAMYLHEKKNKKAPPGFSTSFANLLNHLWHEVENNKPCPGGEEDDPAFRSCISRINGWRDERNSAIHGLAKEEEQPGVPFAARYSGTRKVAVEGIKCLIEYDHLDLADRWNNKAKRNASHPFAFAPLWEAPQKVAQFNVAADYLELNRKSENDWDANMKAVTPTRAPKGSPR